MTVPYTVTSGNKNLTTIIIIIKVSNEELPVVGHPCEESTSL